MKKKGEGEKMTHEFLTDEKIEQIKKGFKYSLASDYSYNKKPYKPAHGHNDRIRTAYEWLDAQKKNKRAVNNRYAPHLPLKHIIEEWATFYVSRDDVEIAADLQTPATLASRGSLREKARESYLFRPIKGVFLFSVTTENLAGFRLRYTRHNKREIL